MIIFIYIKSHISYHAFFSNYYNIHFAVENQSGMILINEVQQINCES